MIFPVLEVPPVHPVKMMVGGVAELGRVPGHPVHQRRELEEGVDHDGGEAEEEGEVERGPDLPRPAHAQRHRLDPGSLFSNR